MLIPLLTLALQTSPPAADGPPIPFGDPNTGAWSWTEEWSPETTYDPSIPRFDTFLGAPAGSRLARHDQILEAFETWAELSPRMELFDHGVTHEGRRLVHAVIGSEANIARLDTLLAEPTPDATAPPSASRPSPASPGWATRSTGTRPAVRTPLRCWPGTSSRARVTT
ncbi:MAG: hypothetical protein ACYTFV_19175 [Planctomycetota bacterium]|jgi:hypothetical protein